MRSLTLTLTDAEGCNLSATSSLSSSFHSTDVGYIINTLERVVTRHFSGIIAKV